MLVGRDQDAPDVWRRAVEIGAEHVLRLPDAEGWLVDQIANAAEGVGRPALTVGVIGGRGGSGASTLACALAVTAARAGRRTMLIDGDPTGDPTGSRTALACTYTLFVLVVALRSRSTRTCEVPAITGRFLEISP